MTNKVFRGRRQSAIALLNATVSPQIAADFSLY
jgi:hypothetical protein